MPRTIRTFVTKKDLDLEDPPLERIDIRDIARALSGINRFIGHTSRPFSVAHHSLMVSWHVAPHLALEALMHDASEAYLGDVSSPLKALLPEYQAIEARWMRVIETRFGLAHCDCAEIKTADRLAFEIEMELLVVGKKPGNVSSPGQSVETRMRWYLANSTRTTTEAGEAMFLARFNELIAERHLAQLERARA